MKPKVKYGLKLLGYIAIAFLLGYMAFCFYYV